MKLLANFRSRTNLFSGVACVAALGLLCALPAAAQMTMRTPDFRGVFNPVVGSGAAYEIDNAKGDKTGMELTVVGKENVAGKPGYWMEMSFTGMKTGGAMYAKDLMVVDGPTTTITRMIIQPPGQQPMDMTAMMSRGPQTPPPSTDARMDAVHVGSETITTPAGTFDCDHYKAKDGSWDAWLSTKVGPWGVVKSVSKDTTMVLTRQITNATDHITGTPQSMADMMRMRMGQQPPSQ